MEIKKLLTKNYNICANKENKYIVIHYTGNPNTSAEQNALYFHNTDNKVSAHYVVDEKDIFQCVLDDNIAWHVGGQPYTNTNPPYFNICKNSNSIGIEMCCIYDNEKQITYKKETILNTLLLTMELMIKYHIPISRVITHRDVTGKNCPCALDFDEYKKELRKMFEIVEKYENLLNEIKVIKEDIYYITKEIHKLNKRNTVYNFWGDLLNLDDNGETYNVIHRLYEIGVYKGASATNLNLTEDIRRMLILNARTGIYGEEIKNLTACK